MTLVETSSIIFISTPKGAPTYLSSMVEMKINGVSLFNVVKISRACHKCNESGKSMTCNHMDRDEVPWESKDQINKLNALYQNSGNTSVALQEIYGISGGKNSRVFDHNDVSCLLDLPRYTIKQRKPTYGFLGYDPSGGGKSEAACSLVYFINHYVVVRFFLNI